MFCLLKAIKDSHWVNSNVAFLKTKNASGIGPFFLCSVPWLKYHFCQFCTRNWNKNLSLGRSPEGAFVIKILTDLILNQNAYWVRYYSLNTARYEYSLRIQILKDRESSGKFKAFGFTSLKLRSSRSESNRQLRATVAWAKTAAESKWHLRATFALLFWCTWPADADWTLI